LAGLSTVHVHDSVVVFDDWTKEVDEPAAPPAAGAEASATVATIAAGRTDGAGLGDRGWRGEDDDTTTTAARTIGDGAASIRQDSSSA
jgi:hypothetical protein